jgi:hypothetical protein
MKEDNVSRKKETKKAPSRVRYESSHPTISCRVSRELYDRLTDIRVEGISFTEILKTGLGILEPKIQKVTEARRDSYQGGYQEGYKQAEQRYKVIYPCCICGQGIEIASDKEKRCAAQYMQEHDWGHTDCLERNR